MREETKEKYNKGAEVGQLCSLCLSSQKGKKQEALRKGLQI